MLQIATSLFTLLCCLGLDQAYVREFHESTDRPALFLNATLPGLIVSLALLTVLMISSPALLSSILFDENSIVFSVGVAFSLVVVYLSRFLSLILRMQERGLTFSMSQLFSKIALLLIIFGYLFFTTTRTFAMLLAAQVSAFFLAFAVFAWNTRRDWWPAMYARFEYRQISRLLGYGWPLVFGGVASWGLATIDRVFLRSMSTYDELAAYSVAASAASAVTVFAGIFNIIWSPMVYRWVADRVNIERVDSIATQMAALLPLIVCFAGGSSWILGYLLPPEYTKVPYIFVGCMVSPLLYTFSEVTGIGIAVTRRTIYSLLASFGAVILNVILCYFLVPKHGATGAMISNMCAFVVFFVLRTEFSGAIWRHSKGRFGYYASVSTIVFLAAVFALHGDVFRYQSIILWWLGLLFFSVYSRRILVSLYSSVRGVLRTARQND